MSLTAIHSVIVSAPTLFALTPEQFRQVGMLFAGVVFIIVMIISMIKGAKLARDKKAAAAEGSQSPESSRPISDACPSCGAKECRKVDSGNEFRILADRICQKCGTQYSPPIPRWLAMLLFPIGVGLIGLGICIGYFGFQTELEFAVQKMLLFAFTLSPPMFGIVAIKEGIKALQNRD